jgi:hypothetical protein
LIMEELGNMEDVSFWGFLKFRVLKFWELKIYANQNLGNLKSRNSEKSKKLRNLENSKFRRLKFIFF